MTTKIELRSTHHSGSDIHIVVGGPKDLGEQVNQAISQGEKFTTFEVPGKKKLSVIADRVEAIWEE